MKRALSLLPALLLLVGVAVVVVWTSPAPAPPWSPARAHGPIAMDPVECGRLLTAVIEGALRKDEAMQVDPPPGCESATFPPPYAIASYPTGAVLLRFNEPVARFDPRATPISARRNNP